MVCNIILLDSNELEYAPKKYEFGAQAFDDYFIYCGSLEYKGVSFTPVEGGGWSKLWSSLEYQTHLPQMPGTPIRPSSTQSGPSDTMTFQQLWVTESFYIVRRTNVASFPLLHPFIQQRLVEFLICARHCSTEDTRRNKKEGKWEALGTVLVPRGCCNRSLQM